MKAWLGRLLVALNVALMLSGCAGFGASPPSERQALRGLADNAARGLLNEPPWPASSTADVTILMQPAEVDGHLPVPPDALNEALGRALLSHADAPHVLDWVPDAMHGDDGNQWLLQATLSADAPPLRLSDRVLQPYRLSFDLSQPGKVQSHWQWHANGAVDLDALPFDATEAD
ncbi:hypothetical protein [Salinicola rhizosphaerae]|uniref:Lipoprotein n=1 Tax=Salinicola rhizosphaerae TaxID=1443141 RepID=A0ABQ3DQZ7_9GAMM|nr:hypothetical protein [Salinicola rhizosphaerae]GHB12562.1 hypothetical protein GCM10009038_08050 [Salinicola rhizosphaerae]